jgi:peptidoglycan/LPS O-acetylase OafA/YrhL
MTKGKETRPTDETEHFAFIDALRGWAILAVMAVHVHGPGAVPAGVERLQVFGIYGVQLFFVISALTLFMSYESRQKKDRRPMAAFFVRRLFRIAPLFWLGVIFYVWWMGRGPRDSAPNGIHWPQILSTACFVHGWHPTSINSVVPGGWSIAVEMNFYLLLPFMVRVLTSLRRSVLACGAALGLSIGLGLVMTRWMMTIYPASQEGLVGGFLYWWLPRQLPVFLLGSVLYFLIRRSKDAPATPPAPESRNGKALLMIGVACGALFALAMVGHRLRQTYFMASCCFVLLGLGLSRRPVVLFVNPFTRFLGKVSYSAYLTHFFVVDLLSRLLAIPGIRLPMERHPLAALLVLYGACVAGTLAISTLTHYLIEIPGQNFGKWLITRWGWGRSSPGSVNPGSLPQPQVAE